MNICIDMRPALSHPTGVGIYLLNLVQALSQIDSENQYHLFSASWRERYRPPKYGKNFHPHDHHWPGKLLHLAWNRFSFPSIESLLRVPIDVAHSPSPLLIPSKQAHRVTTVHDLYFYLHPDDTTREIRRDYGALIQDHCQKSDAIISVSDYTKHQLVEHLKVAPSRIYTIRHGVNPLFLECASKEEFDAVKNKFGLKRDYFLFVGTLEPRKNVPALVEAFQSAALDADLVLAGPEGWNLPELSATTSEQIRFTGYVDLIQLRALYQHSIALVLPSIEEGFGMPVVEAMACGAPVVASDIPVFHEIAQEAFLPVDTTNKEAFIEALRKIKSDAQLRGDLVAKGKERVTKFSWRECAEKTLDLYRNL